MAQRQYAPLCLYIYRFLMEKRIAKFIIYLLHEMLFVVAGIEARFVCVRFFPVLCHNRNYGESP